MLCQCPDPLDQKGKPKAVKVSPIMNMLQLAIHYDFEMETLGTGQKDSQACCFAHSKNTVCIVLVGCLVYKLDRDQILVVCVLHALAQLCFQLLLFCLSGLPPVPMCSNMLGIIQHTHM